MPDRSGATDSPLRHELLTGILAPFAESGNVISVAIEDPEGRILAAHGPTWSSPATDRAGTAIALDVRADGVVIGRVLARGSGVDGGTLAAVGGALANALSAVVEETVARRAVEATLSSVEAAAEVDRHHRIDGELALGRRLQRSFVSIVAPDVPGYDLASHYEQATEVGGDFFDLFRLHRRGRPLTVVIADVTGKGIAAALLMAFARPVIHAALDNARGPADALERTNMVLRERRAALFITAIAATLTPSRGRLRLANAGHEPPLLVRRDGSPIEPLEGSGPLLGAFRSLDLVETATDVQPGDIAVLYTDGVTDARSATGDRFEEARLLEAIEAARGGTAHDVVDSIRDSVNRFQAGTLPADDVTVVAIGRRARGTMRRRRPERTLG